MAAASANTHKFHHGFPTPGPQIVTGDDVVNHIFFASEATWKDARETTEFDYIVIGSGFCALAFVDRILKNDKKKPKILIVERGSFFLPEHFQNLPPVFKRTLPEQRFMSETFPWTVSKQSTNRKQYATWQHGMVPFFGGRSTLWSAWCPRPSDKHSELKDWPRELQEMMTDTFFKDAETLLNVISADELESSVPEDKRIFDTLQKEFQNRLITAVDNQQIKRATRAIPAPLAVGRRDDFRVDFAKYSVVGPLLQLVEEYPKQLVIATRCVVERIVQQEGSATALETSRGVLPLGKAKLILAMGCMPAATLLLNSFPKDPIKMLPGSKFSAHFISAIVARVPRADYTGDNLKARNLNPIEMGALYLAGLSDNHSSFHIQISIISDSEPNKHLTVAQRYMPDVVASASPEQLKDSQDHILFVLAVLGEMDVNNEKNWFHLLPPEQTDGDRTANCMLQFVLNDKDKKLWDEMDETAFATVDAMAANKENIQYWSNDKWSKEKPKMNERRVEGMVHESSVLPIGSDSRTSCVNMNFRLHDVDNTYVTGSSIWPTGASWNPTMVMCGFAQRLADQLANK